MRHCRFEKWSFRSDRDGVTEITELQFPNSKRMNAKAALNSKKILGCIFNG